MKKMFLIACLILGTYVAAADKPYEATWLEVTKINNRYVVYKYPDYKEPIIIRVKGDSLIYTTDLEMMSYKLVNIKYLGNDSYFMLGKFHSPKKNDLDTIRFKYVDKEKHIVKWKIIEHGGNIIKNDIMYVDSLYNTFSVLDYDGPAWGQGD